MHRIAAALLGISLLTALPATAQEATEPAADPRVDRVAALCEAWTAVRYLHPNLAYRDVDWDRAFADAASATWRAPGDDRAAYRAAAEGMLAAMDDPLTRLVAEDDGAEATEAETEDAEAAGTAEAEPASAAEPPPLFDWIEQPRDGGEGEDARGVLRIDLAGALAGDAGTGVFGRLWREVIPEAEKARGVIVDLRYAPELGMSPVWIHGVLDDRLGGFVARKASGATERWLVHWGYAGEGGGASSGGYQSAFTSSLPAVYSPTGPPSDSPAAEIDRAPVPVVFLINERTELPDSGLAFRAAGNGYVVSEARPGADDGPDALPGQRSSYDLGEGLWAQVRVTERVPPAGASLEPDALVAPATEENDPAVEAALEWIEAFSVDSTSPGESASASAATRPAVALRSLVSDPYPEMTSPDLGYRLLAGCRAWGVIRHFYPYLHLLDDWDGAFRDSLPELATAEGEAGYARAILRLMAHVEDGHTNVWGHPGIAEVRGAVPPPIRIRSLDGEIVVTRIVDPDFEGLEVGDVVLTVDGVPIEERIEALRPVTTASRDLTHRTVAARWALSGPADSTAVLTVRGADGEIREVEAPRGGQARAPEEPEENPWRRLDPTEHALGELSVGYVDLTELRTPQVAPAMADLAETDAIVFDLRGYPNGTAWPLAPYLNVNGAEEWAQFRRREVSYLGFGGSMERGFYFVQGIPRSDEIEPYAGRTVMLLDERAISQSEHTALMFRQAASTTFVGTPTAGANGDVTRFVLPGGMMVLFTGHDVRHADGTQLQRIGILPDIEVEPTVEGIRAGRDEVLEAALEYLRGELADASP